MNNSFHVAPCHCAPAITQIGLLLIWMQHDNLSLHVNTPVGMLLIVLLWNDKIRFKKKRLPGVGCEPGSSQFHLISHFSPLYRWDTAAPHDKIRLQNFSTQLVCLTLEWTKHFDYFLWPFLKNGVWPVVGGLHTTCLLLFHIKSVLLFSDYYDYLRMHM
jgi:hypothetical protein